ncbi:MAG: metallopeptidase family protein [Pseudomonadota bacterium]
MTGTSPEEFVEIARTAYESLPEAFRQLSRDIIIRVDNFAADDVLADLGIQDRYGLLGLYHGIDVTQKSGFDTVPHQDMVFLYRAPILRFWQEGPDSLEKIIQHVLVHEIGHHFGLSDEDMHALEDEARREGG